MVKKSPLPGCVFEKKTLRELLMRMANEDQPGCISCALCWQVPCREILAWDFAGAQADVWIPDL